MPRVRNRTINPPPPPYVQGYQVEHMHANVEPFDKSEGYVNINEINRHVFRTGRRQCQIMVSQVFASR